MQRAVSKIVGDIITRELQDQATFIERLINEGKASVSVNSLAVTACLVSPAIDDNSPSPLMGYYVAHASLRGVYAAVSWPILDADRDGR